MVTLALAAWSSWKVSCAWPRCREGLSKLFCVHHHTGVGAAGGAAGAHSTECKAPEVLVHAAGHTVQVSDAFELSVGRKDVNWGKRKGAPVRGSGHQGRPLSRGLEVLLPTGPCVPPSQEEGVARAPDARRQEGADRAYAEGM